MGQVELAARSSEVKRPAKIFLAVPAFFFAAIIGLTIYVKVKYPAERLKQLLISHMAEEYKIRIAVAQLDFSLLSGFTLDKIALLGSTTEKTSDDLPLSIEKIKFAYRWRSLLARRLDIDEITVEHPSFFYRQNSDSSSNLDFILAALADSATTPSDTASAGLPISIHLKTLALENLQIRAALISQIDSQHVEFGPANFSVNEIEIDRAARFGGKIKLSAASANLHYFKRLVGQSNPLTIFTHIQSQISGSFSGDSIAITGELALDRSRIKLNNESDFSLPRLGTAANVRYDFITSQLAVPDVRLFIDDKEQLAARFEMNQQNSLSTLALRVKSGALDLAHLLNLAKTHTSGESRNFLQKIACAGELEFSGSEFKSDQMGMVYQITLRGRDLAYRDNASGLKFAGGQLEMGWKTNADSSTALTGKFHFETFDVPVDTEQTLKTGPVDLNKLNLVLTKDFLPQRGDLNLIWQNFSQGKINASAFVGPSSASLRSDSWLSRLLGSVEINAAAIEISPFTAGAAAGKISGKIALAGKRLDEADLKFDLRNEEIRYETIDYKGKIPDYHLSASSKLIVNPALTKFSLPNGKLQIEPAQASFNATYDMKADTFRFNLPNLALDLAQATRALPDPILASMNYAKVKGRGAGSGWLQGRFLEPDSLDYNGIFVLHSEDAAYADSVLGIYTDSLQINSEWLITTSTTTGKYDIACSTPKLPDYLRQPLPPTNAGGKLTVDETTFTITDGTFEIPDWKTAGNYRVDGEFRPAGMQIKTTVDLEMRAPKPINLDRNLALRGDGVGQFIIEQYIPDALNAPQPSRLTGWLRIAGMDIRVDTVLALNDLQADCRFNQNFDLLYLPPDSTMAKGMKLEPQEDLQPYLVLKSPAQPASQAFANADEALLMYDLFRESRRDNGGWLKIGKIDLLGYQLNNLAADLNLGNSRFDIPKFSLNLFNGNLVGNLLVGFGNGNLDSISYATNLQISSIEVSRFRRLSAQLGGKQSRASANLFLSGLGTDAKKLEEVANNLSGRLNITKIENKVASNLLQMLDPNGTDKGIQNMRLLMKTRWNVRQLTFEIKNGFVYASLAHVKPWYAPFTLPQPLDFARFPIKPYLKTAAAE